MKNFFFRNKRENQNLKSRRSIYAVSDIKKGEKFTKKNIRVIRPGYGIELFYYEKILNKICPQNIKLETAISKKVLRLLKLN